MKGFFTQTACVLLEHVCTLGQIETALQSFEVVKRNEGTKDWHFSGPEVAIAFRSEKNGYILVDVVDHPWPDDMGSPQNAPDLFAAWSMGYFGPFAYPGGLTRAGQQCWHWEEGRTISQRHRGFIRVRSSYSLGAKSDDLVMPEDYDSVAELMRVTEIASILAQMKESLCYFNPNGESLQSAAMVQEALDWFAEGGPPPLNIWSNVRLFNFEHTGGWSMMDTVGLGQVDVPDQEACFVTQRYDLGEVSQFLLNASLYLMTNGFVIKDGDTMNGPGNKNWQGRIWQGRIMKNGLLDPPRETLRWFPLDKSSPPVQLLDKSSGGE